MKNSLKLWSLPQSESFSVLPWPTNDNFNKFASTNLFYMVLFKKKFSWLNHLALRKRITVWFYKLNKPSMDSYKLQWTGLKRWLKHSYNLASCAKNVITLYSSTLIKASPCIIWSMVWHISYKIFSYLNSQTHWSF